MRFDLVPERLARMPDPLPSPADLLMPVIVGGPERHPPQAPPPGRSGRPAGVLVLLYPDVAGDTRVVLIERATRDGHHSGEVSFPGGKAEPDDVDIEATALRESAEEIGLDVGGAGVRVVARLDSFWIPVSDYEVSPVVAVAERQPVLTPSPDEVARIVAPRMARFLPSSPIVIVERRVRDWPLRYGAYDIDGLSVWGATARILSQLGAVLAP